MEYNSINRKKTITLKGDFKKDNGEVTINEEETNRYLLEK